MCRGADQLLEDRRMIPSFSNLLNSALAAASQLRRVQVAEARRRRRPRGVDVMQRLVLDWRERAAGAGHVLEFVEDPSEERRC
jgi:hypothetical protein